MPYRPHPPLSMMQQQQQQQQPPLGLTGVLCQSQNLSIPNRGILHYTIFRPRNLKYVPPLVCVAGGPLLPCIYLQPIVHLITDRSIVFYDALGCGQSKISTVQQQKQQQQQPAKCKLPSCLDSTIANPDEKPTMTASASNENMISDMVQDLTCLIQHLSLPHFHLLGHSFGGIVAYEFLKQQQQQQQQQQSSLGSGPREVSGSSSSNCLSLTLVSTPVSIAQAIQHSHKLQAELRQKHPEGSDVDNNEAVLAEYAKQHECRLEPIPLPLQQALFGVFSSTSKGLAAVHNYSALPQHSNDSNTSEAEDTRKETNLNSTGDDKNKDPHNSNDSNNVEAEVTSIENNEKTTGSDNVIETEAPCGGNHADSLFPPSLVIRGEHDFVSTECQEAWKHLLGHHQVQFVTIPNSAHYAMLENEDAFASALRSILHDPPAQYITLPNGVQVRGLGS
ncbi:hypothetical protein ACA910_010319 [Epithemia clementina (nom. ined.)]